MKMFSKSGARVLIILTVITAAFASTGVTKIETIKQLLGRDNFEWTAFGDSYSSGVGAGEYVIKSYRCLRYDHAYPALMNADIRLPPGDHEFHNAVCSGSNTTDVQAYQFYDEDTERKPNWQYGIIFNCILEAKLPFNVIPSRPCEEQKEVTWALLVNQTLVYNIDTTIKKIVEKARSGPVGNSFKLYVTGFPQFFNEETEECDHVTFAQDANPVDDGKPHQMMTRDVRKEYNLMSVQLNKAIQDAVSRNVDQGVRWVAIDGVMGGHRFCEPGIREPDQRNPQLWVYHYPYNEPRDEAVDGPLEKALTKVSAGVDVNEVFKTYTAFQNALLDAIELDDPNNPSPTDFLDVLFRGLGRKLKVFHPQIPLHEKIKDLVLDSYINDLAADKKTGPPPPPNEDKNECHGISGNYWVMSRDVAVENVQAFCQQSAKTVTYNAGSVNELSLSVGKLDDDSKGPADAPDCLGRFQRAVIDGCDGNDPVNNPHNYKFGSTLTTADGWQYTMTPLSKQVNEVSCDVSYKFFFDSFEIRGKNLPNAKFGANGEGLKAQLSGCGALTKWNFERTPDDVKFQWYASGHLPIGTKSCVGNALVSAGGAGDGNCHGAGKRADGLAPRRPNGIDDWPGYGDEGKHVFNHTAVG